MDDVIFFAWFIPAFIGWFMLASFAASRFVDWDMARRARRRRR